MFSCVILCMLCVCVCVCVLRQGFSVALESVLELAFVDQAGLDLFIVIFDRYTETGYTPQGARVTMSA